MKYREKRNILYDLFYDIETVGKYSMPKIEPIHEVDILNLLPYNYAKTCPAPKEYYLCFYVDDYQFERIWNSPQKCLDIIKQFKGIIAPDFSIYRDFPTILNIYNCWRSKLMTVYYQRNGIKVIPNVQWSDEASFKWCFDGLPKNSIVAITSNGCQRDKIAKQLFLNGFYEMKRRLEPEKIIVVGTLPQELAREPNLILFDSYTTLFGKVEKCLTFRGTT